MSVATADPPASAASSRSWARSCRSTCAMRTDRERRAGIAAPSPGCTRSIAGSARSARTARSAALGDGTLARARRPSGRAARSWPCATRSPSTPAARSTRAAGAPTAGSTPAASSRAGPSSARPTPDGGRAARCRDRCRRRHRRPRRATPRGPVAGRRPPPGPSRSRRRRPHRDRRGGGDVGRLRARRPHPRPTNGPRRRAMSGA